MSWTIPQGANRIKVKDENGQTLWRKIPQMVDTDEVILNPKTNEPYFMFGSSGRPSKNTPQKPVQVAQSKSSSKVKAKEKSKDKHIRRDPVFRIANEQPDSGDVLTNVIKGLAEESASLSYERREAERKGESTSSISLRRVNALKAVGEVWLKKKEVLSAKSLDLESHAFRIVFGHIAETFRKACDEAGLRPEMTESVFANFGRLVDEPEWIADAKSKIEKG